MKGKVTITWSELSSVQSKFIEALITKDKKKLDAKKKFDIFAKTSVWLLIIYSCLYIDSSICWGTTSYVVNPLLFVKCESFDKNMFSAKIIINLSLFWVKEMRFGSVKFS